LGVHQLPESLGRTDLGALLRAAELTKQLYDTETAERHCAAGNSGALGRAPGQLTT